MTTALQLSDPFSARFGKPLPAPLREAALGTSWTSFVQTYSAASGPIRFGAWSSEPARAGRSTFDATFAMSDTILSCRATAFGPIEALTDMLHDAGFPIEILAFHQQSIGDSVATFVHCEHGGRRTWSMAIATDCAESSVRAVISAANLLH